MSKIKGMLKGIVVVVLLCSTVTIAAFGFVLSVVGLGFLCFTYIPEPINIPILLFS